MSIDKSLTKYEKAQNDYNSGMKYKDIADKYKVSENTIKTWKRRYGWENRNATKKVFTFQELGNKFDDIKNDLMNQLISNGIIGEHFVDLIDIYMELFNIKNDLIADIKERGVNIEWCNGNQTGFKKNDCIGELHKTVDRMLDIINALGLKPSPLMGGDNLNDDDDL